jgi:hypothetical protein
MHLYFIVHNVLLIADPPTVAELRIRSSVLNQGIPFADAASACFLRLQTESNSI